MASPPKSRSEIKADLTAAKQIQGPLFRVYYTMHNHMHSTFFVPGPTWLTTEGCHALRGPEEP